LAARSGLAGVTRGSSVAEPLHRERALRRALDHDIAAVRLVTPARDQLELTHGIERARDHGFRHLQLGGKSAHSMRRRLQINCEQDRELARRKVRLAVGDEREGEVLQQLEGL
jgi:hypothetical protein